MDEKVDLKKSLDSYKAKVGQFRIVDVPEQRYLMVDGHGDPNTSPLYTDSIETLYPVAYKMKFASKRDLGRDYVVMPLEGLWWADDMDAFTTVRDKSAWAWTMSASRPCPKGCVSRRCTSAPTTTKPRCSRGCTTSSSRATL